MILIIRERASPCTTLLVILTSYWKIGPYLMCDFVSLVERCQIIAPALAYWTFLVSVNALLDTLLAKDTRAFGLYPWVKGNRKANRTNQNIWDKFLRPGWNYFGFIIHLEEFMYHRCALSIRCVPDEIPPLTSAVLRIHARRHNLTFCYFSFAIVIPVTNKILILKIQSWKVYCGLY